jgi:hypothetical protein
MQFFNVLEKNATAAAMIFSKTYRDRAAAAMTSSKICRNRAAMDIFGAAHAKSIRPKNQVYISLSRVKSISFDSTLNLEFFDTSITT